MMTSTKPRRGLYFESEPVTLVGITKRFDETVAVQAFDLVAEAGQITTLLGPSGCGKTTTLRMVAGFFFPDEGEIYVGDERVTDTPPNKRPTRTVFQNYALFPHMTVNENVAFGLNVLKVSRSEQTQRVNDILEIVGLGGMGTRQPGQLSGGQQQRVALARALVTRPKVLLLDEPLSNLDAKLRIVMREEIRRLQSELGITTIYVTHDQEEALSLSDKIVVMNKGEALQIGTPSEIYEQPVNRFVAQFLGLSNFIKGELIANEVDGVRVRFGDGYQTIVRAAPGLRAGALVDVTIRPENLVMTPIAADHSTITDPEAHEGIDGEIVSRSYLGAVARYRVRLSTQDEEIIIDEHAPLGLTIYAEGTPVRIRLREGRGYVQAEG